MSAPRILAIIGSGETAPTMTSTHVELFALAGDAGRIAVMLDTPFGFQENAPDITARSLAYFRDSVGREVEVASFREAATATALEYEQMCARVAAAGWVFAGPGSPTYAIRQWLGTRVPGLLADKLRDGGVVVFSSAAAVGLGELALPVYEIYKVGEPVRWVAGLDLLSHSGIRAAVVPHYNNAEGGTHDTRFCYMGERRLRLLEQELPDGCGILGVDEHTACLIDGASGSMVVRGRGRVTWRRHGVEKHWGAGDRVALEDVVTGASGAVTSTVSAGPAAAAPDSAPTPFMEQVMEQRDAARVALGERDTDGVAAAILTIETALHEWSHDTLQSDEPQRARDALRELVASLAGLGKEGTADPRLRLAPLVEALLVVRDEAREARRFSDADRLRDAILAAGVVIHDTPAGTTWDIAPG